MARPPPSTKRGAVRVRTGLMDDRRSAEPFFTAEPGRPSRASAARCLAMRQASPGLLRALMNVIGNSLPQNSVTTDRSGVALPETLP